MRRRSTNRFGDRQFKQYNVRRDVDPKRLQAIGAMILQWNYIEGALNLILDVALKLPFELWVPVHSRINGTDGKVALIKETFDLPAPIPEQAQLPIRKALNAVEHYKKYRDGIAHVFLTHPNQIVAESIQRKGMTDEVLLSQEALDCLNDHLECLQGELDALAMIFHHRSAGFHARDDNEREQLAEEIRQSMALLHHHQAMRENLKPLPEFPAPPPAPAKTEASQEPGG
jgi:hypothetical protein